MQSCQKRASTTQFRTEPFKTRKIAIAIDVCKQSKTAKEAGKKLFAATHNRNPSTSNGATHLQRLFAKVGIKVKFKAGTPEFTAA